MRARAGPVCHARAGPGALPAEALAVQPDRGDGQEHRIPDLVRRDFTAGAPGLKMVGDITYIETWEGWVYLATVIDCHTKAVVGWAMDDNYKTPLIEKAIDMAARNHVLADQAIFHSDRGSNYTSSQFARKLMHHKLRHSVGRTGICYDNSMAESALRSPEE
jgi:transposase InsO family protein